jgi:O-antigen/teichoic acid export membrane protein
MQSKNIKFFFWYLTPFILRYLLPLLTLPIFTDFLSVSDFGIYALAVFYGVFGSGIINLGLLTVFERNFFELNSRKRKSLLFTTLIFTLLNFFLIYLLTHIFSDFISESLFKQKQLRDILPLALAFQTFKTFNQYFFIFFKNYENAKKYSYYSILESILSTGLPLIFVFASMGIYGFILGQFLGVFLVFILMFTILLYPFSNRFKFYLLKNQLRMSLPLTPRIFFGVINTQFDRYMLGLLGTVGGVGLYDIGQKNCQYFFFVYDLYSKYLFASGLQKTFF